jgi:hypothetical protein
MRRATVSGDERPVPHRTCREKRKLAQKTVYRHQPDGRLDSQRREKGTGVFIKPANSFLVNGAGAKSGFKADALDDPLAARLGAVRLAALLRAAY